MTSPPPKPRSLRKVRPGAAILRQKTLFLFPPWGVSSQLQEPNSVCVPGDVKMIVLALLTLQVLHSWDTTQSIRDGGRGDGVQLQNFPCFKLYSLWGIDSPIFLDWLVWMLGQSEWDTYWSRVGMEKSFSRDLSTNKNSWQLPLTSIINCYSLGHGESCFVGHTREYSGRVKGKLSRLAY